MKGREGCDIEEKREMISGYRWGERKVVVFCAFSESLYLGALCYRPATEIAPQLGYRNKSKSGP